MISLTPKQSQLLRYLEGYMSGPGSVAPSVREMMAAIGSKSLGTVHDTLCALEERGHIRRKPSRARAIELLTANPLHDATTDALVAELSRRGYFDRRAA